MGKKLTDEDLKFNIIVNGNDAQKKLGDLGKAQRELREEEKLLRQEKAKLLKTDKDYEKKLTELTTKIKENKAAQSKNTQEQEKYRKEVGLVGLTMNQLSKESKRLRSIMNSLTPGTDEWKKYKDDLEKVNDRINEVRGSTKKGNNEFSNQSSILDELSSRFPVLGGLLGKHNKEVDAAGKSTSRWGKAIKGIGIIGLIAGIGALTKQFYKLKTGIDQDRAAVKKFTDESGADLDATTAKARALADTYDKDFNEVLMAANTYSKEMGISMSEGLDKMAKGFQTGADANDEFLDKLKEYPAQFKTAGLSADETIALMSQEATSGIFSDKGTDAIKEATIRLREMTPVTEKALKGIGISAKELQKELKSGSMSYTDAIKLISTNLGKLPEQSREVGEVLADVFGGAGEDAGIRFIKSLKDMDLNLGNLVEKSNEFQNGQERLRKVNEELNLQWNELLGGSDNFFAGAQASLKEYLIWVLKGIKYLKENKETVIVLASALAAYTAIVKGQIIVDKLKVFWNNKIIGSFKKLFATISKNPWGALAAVIATVAVAVYQFTKKQKEATKVYSGFAAKVDAEKGTMNAMFEQLKKTNEGSDERKRLIKEINDKYGEYLPNLLTEKSTLIDIEKAQKAANQALVRSLAIKQKGIDLEKVTEKNAEELKKKFESVLSGFSVITPARKAQITKELQELAEIQIDGDPEKIAQMREQLKQTAGIITPNAQRDFYKVLNNDFIEYVELLKQQKNEIADVAAYYDGYIKVMDEALKVEEKNKKKGSGLGTGRKDYKKLYQLQEQFAKESIDRILNYHFESEEQIFKMREKYGLTSQAELLQRELQAFKNSRAAKAMTEEQYLQTIDAIHKKHQPSEIEMPEEKEQPEDPDVQRALLTEEYKMRLHKSTLEGKLEAEKEFLRNKFEAGEMSEMEYNDRLRDLDTQYYRDKAAIANNAMQMMGGLANAFSQLRMSQMELEKKKEIENADGNKKKIEQIEAKYAKKKRQEQLKMAYINMALAIGNALATVVPFIPNALVAAGIAGIKGMAEVNMIKAQMKDGGYSTVIGAQDGKKYRARKGKKPGMAGMIEGANVLLANEDGKPEYYVSNAALNSNSKDPLGLSVADHVEAIEYLSGRRVTPQKRDGGYSNVDNSQPASTLQPGATGFENAIARFENAIAKIENGVPAYYGDDEVRTIRTRSSDFDKVEGLGK
jgi:myosin heavy subunit